jgi:hypothetical protein
MPFHSWLHLTPARLTFVAPDHERSSQQQPRAVPARPGLGKASSSSSLALEHAFAALSTSSSSPSDPPHTHVQAQHPPTPSPARQLQPARTAKPPPPPPPQTAAARPPPARPVVVRPPPLNEPPPTCLRACSAARVVDARPPARPCPGPENSAPWFARASHSRKPLLPRAPRTSEKPRSRGARGAELTTDATRRGAMPCRCQPPPARSWHGMAPRPYHTCRKPPQPSGI